MKKSNNIEQYEFGSGLSRKGVTPPYGLVIGFTAWAVPMLAGLGFLFNETTIKPIREHFKKKQSLELNDLYVPQRQMDEIEPNKLFDLEKSFNVPDKLAINKTYQVMPTFENVADKYL